MHFGEGAVGLTKRADKAGTGRLTIVGGAKPKARKRSARDWTRAKETAFLSTLADTCNVTAAAEAAGVSTGGAYKRRKAVAAFRAGWADALSAAYQQLEMVLLERALNGTEKVVKRRDGSEERMRDYPNHIALHLLKMHRESALEASAEPSEADVEELRQRLFDKLERVRKREEARETGQ